MPFRHLRKQAIWFSGAGLLLVLAFQACGRGSLISKFPSAGAKNQETPTGTLPPVTELPAASVEGKALYTQHCAACHGAFENSAKTGRTLENIKLAIRDVPVMALAVSNLTASQLQAIANALEVRTAQTGGANPFVCGASQDPAETELRRLSRREYLNTLEALMAGQVSLAELRSQIDLLPADTVSDTFDTVDNGISSNHPQAYLAVAKRASELLVLKPAWVNSVLNCNHEAQGMSAACWQNFFAGFARQVFRRPLTEQEKVAYKELYTAHSDGSVLTGLQTVVQGLLQSPHFTYKVELGGVAVSGSTSTYKLNDYELATRLAFFATGAGPSADLLNKAADGTFATTEGYKLAVNSLFASEKAKRHIKEFYTQWLGLNRLPPPNQTDWFFGNVPKQTLRTEAIQEIDDFMNHYIWNTPGTFADLLLSEKNFVRGPSLASVYNAPVVSHAYASTQVVEAESMTASTGRAEDSGWNLFSNGTFKKSVALNVGQSYVVIVRAKAHLAQNMGANMIVRYGAQALGASLVGATQYSEFTFKLVPSVATAEFTIEFDNDVYNAATNEDRNLLVDSISFNSEAPVSGGPASDETLPAGERPGVMSRVAMLLSGSNQASLVHRGLVLRRNLLCDKIKNPVIGENEKDLFVAPVSDPLASMRTQIETRTNSARCLSCHSTINPAGFVLEQFDSLGRFRRQETVYNSTGGVLATHPINATVVPNIELPNEAPVDGLKAFAQTLSQSSRGPACLSQQWFTYSMGREPVVADNCSLSRLFQSLRDPAFQSSSGDSKATLLNMLKAAAFDSQFKLRKHGPVQ